MQTHLPQKHHVFGEATLEMLVDHGVAAVFHHDALPGELLQPRQRIDQHLRFLVGAQVGVHVEMEPWSLQFSSHILLYRIPLLRPACAGEEPGD